MRRFCCRYMLRQRTGCGLASYQARGLEEGRWDEVSDLSAKRDLEHIGVTQNRHGQDEIRLLVAQSFASKSRRHSGDARGDALSSKFATF